MFGVLVSTVLPLWSCIGVCIGRGWELSDEVVMLRVESSRLAVAVGVASELMMVGGG